MTIVVEFLPPAKQEMLSAAAYYDEQSPGLGKDFLIEVRRVTDSIAQTPDIGRKLDSATRRRIIRSFPFAVLYRVDADLILVVAVMHLRRRPNYWRERIVPNP